MTKHHLQNLAEQILNKGHRCAIEFDDIQTKMVVDERPVRLLAYQIHQEKGGSDLDNWFEAERDLVNNY